MNTAVSSPAYSPQQVIGKALGLDPTELFNEGNRGLVQLGTAMLHLQLHLRDKEKILLLMADLGPLPVKQRNEHHQRMLVANSGWSDLAGGTLCTNDSGDRALLRLRLDLNTLGSESLAQWTEAFSVAAVAWSKRIAAVESPTDALDALPQFMSPPQHFSDFSPFNRA